MSIENMERRENEEILGKDFIGKIFEKLQQVPGETIEDAKKRKQDATNMLREEGSKLYAIKDSIADYDRKENIVYALSVCIEVIESMPVTVEAIENMKQAILNSETDIEAFIKDLKK